jgi:F-type H+-transporting ATPase subunit epsilon
MSLTLQIVTPERALPAQRVDHVTLMAVDGEVGVRAGHAPLVALLKPGYVLAKTGGLVSVVVAVRGGVGQVFKDTVTILAEAATDIDAVNPAKVTAAIEKAKALPAPADPLAAKARQKDLDYLAIQLRLPKRQMSQDEMQSGARAAVDAAQHH